MEATAVKQLDATQFGVAKTEATQIEKAFVPMATKLREMEDEYNDIIGQEEITDDLALKARILRLSFVRIRTAADDAHKEGKAKLLMATKAWDGLRNILKYAASDKEDALKKIEKHREIIEAERKEKLKQERESILAKYDSDFEHVQLGEMVDEVWENYLSGVKLAYDQKISAEKKAEEDRIAQEKAEAAEREKIRKENEKLKREAKAKEKKLAEERTKVKAEQARQYEILEKEMEAKSKLEAELKAKKAAEQKAANEAAEVEKKSRLAPDKEKLLALADVIDDIGLPELANPEATEILYSIKTLLGKTTTYIREKSKAI